MTETNANQRAFWSDQAGPLWVAQMKMMDAALAPVLDLLLKNAQIAPGERVLDIGCGAGTSTLAAAAAAGPKGDAQGFDISDTLLTLARQRADGQANVSFAHGDAQTHRFETAKTNCLISRFGVMFFDDTTAALANMATALLPGGRMVFATWGEIPENPYFTLPARIAREVVGTPPKTDPDAPGPFALRDIARVKAMFHAAGMTDVDAAAVPLELTPQGGTEDAATLIAQRNPVVLAKEIASLDVLCNGRLLFGIGAGYLHQEFAALGVDFVSRGARTDEYINAMRALWNQPLPKFAGKFVNFDNIQAQPRPVQPGGPPVIVGGASPAALRRAVTHGNGWYGFALDVSATGKVLEGLQLALARYERPAHLGDLEISITPPKPPTRTMLDEYAALGVHRLIPMLGFYQPDNIMHALENLASELL